MESLYGLFVALNTFTEAYVTRRNGVEVLASKATSETSFTRPVQYLLNSQAVFDLVILVSIIWLTYTFTRNHILRSRDSIRDELVQMNEQLRNDQAEMIEMFSGLTAQNQNLEELIRNISFPEFTNSLITINSIADVRMTTVNPNQESGLNEHRNDRSNMRLEMEPVQ